nr:basic leucine zipper transcriptional factor ATF-like 3 [Vulpes vulpes]
MGLHLNVRCAFTSPFPFLNNTGVRGYLFPGAHSAQTTNPKPLVFVSAGTKYFVSLHRQPGARERRAGAQEDVESPEDDDRKVRRREKNRVAAQRSRKKQTQKADKLHEEYECLEQENTVLRREIGKLTEELKHLSEALKEHEKTCPLLLCPMNFLPVPRPDPVAGCLPR